MGSIEYIAVTFIGLLDPTVLSKQARRRIVESICADYRTQIHKLQNKEV